MLIFKKGNLLDSKCYALVNTVNIIGVMGKGIALQFKNEFPHNYKVYHKACQTRQLKIGGLLTVRDRSLLLGERLIINLPTKNHWRLPSEYISNKG
ncbi:macro domain-containing protein [Mucilaginibacter sp. L196]|uniref:macro domain-containing protein n=1 Tax=Mucilaginibacter sp. L196 TaxID=1641870 RepID=UPI00131B1975|nr:macro domain-containing protein [Mucilaginibacter sp. L196]